MHYLAQRGWRCLKALNTALILILLLTGLALAQTSPPADSAEYQCYRFAASPMDTGLPQGLSGVAFDQIDATAAVPACEQAWKESAASVPLNARLAFTLGRAYSAAKENEKAASLYKQSAESGFSLAINNLAVLYREGTGGLPQDFEEAYRLFAAAGAKGLLLGHRNAALLIEEGKLGAPDWNKAAIHWRVLADNGDSEAATRLQATLPMVRFSSRRQTM